MSRACLLPLIALGAILCLATPGAADEKENPLGGVERVDVRSAYLSQSLLHGHQIHLRAKLRGEGRLTVNPNACSTNEFGDPTRCTRRAPMVHKIKISPVRVDDPRQAGRRLFQVRGESLPEGLRVSLVVPKWTRAHQGPYRLILTNGNMSQIITMVQAAPATPSPIEPTPPVEPPPAVTPQPPKPPQPPGKIDYKAYQRGQLVTLEVRGKHPTAGYKTTLRRSGSIDGSLLYQLIQKPPAGPAAQVITPFSLTRTFRSEKQVPSIIVSDGRGSHTVKVDQR